MVPIPEEYTYEYFLTGPADTSNVTVTCLLPNGIVICLNTKYDVTLIELKEDIWIAAQAQPLFGFLYDMSMYVFLFINSMAQMEEVTDENRKLCDIKPTGAVLKIAECSKEKVDVNHSLNVQISHLIGKRLEEFDALSSAEVNDFRFQMKKFGEELVNQRLQLDNEEKLLYHYPRRIASKEAFKKYFNYMKKDIVVTVKLDNKFSLSVSPEIYPEKLLEKYLEKMANRLNIRENVDNYVLKVFGQDEYLVGDYQLIEFQYIQEAISNDVIPELLVVKKSDIMLSIEDIGTINHSENKKSSFSTLTLRKRNKYKSAWNISDMFKITLNTITGINCDTKRNVEIGIQVSIFHGGKSLCEPQKITERTIEDKGQFEIYETLDFNIEVCNIPKNAKLCFVVYEVSRNSKSNKTRKIKESVNKKFGANYISDMAMERAIYYTIRM